MAGVNDIIAVDLGGTNLRVGLVRGNKILKYIKIKTPKQRDKLIKALYDSISSVMTKNVKGIGVSSAGPLYKGVIKNPPNLPLKNFDMKGNLRRVFKKKVEVENDANCVALAEAKLGCKKKNFVALTLGTGIGGGVIIDGKLYTGQGYASEPGHMILDNGKDFEEIWQSIRRETRNSSGKTIMIKDLLKRKDKKARKILKEFSVYLGQGISSLIDIFDPEVVILMGGAREAGSAFLNMIRSEAKKYTALPKIPRIEWSKIEHPGILGASLLVR